MWHVNGYKKNGSFTSKTFWVKTKIKGEFENDVILFYFDYTVWLNVNSIIIMTLKYVGLWL